MGWRLVDGFFSQPGRRLALATVVPVAVVVLLWVLGHKSWNAYERLQPAARVKIPGRDQSRSMPPAADPSVPPIGRRRMWNGAEPVRRMRSLHVCAGFATAGLFLQVARCIAACNPVRAGVLPLLSALARRLGAHDEAVAWCQRAEQGTGSASAAIMLGYALRRAGTAGRSDVLASHGAGMGLPRPAAPQGRRTVVVLGAPPGSGGSAARRRGLGHRRGDERARSRGMGGSGDPG